MTIKRNKAQISYKDHSSEESFEVKKIPKKTIEQEYQKLT